MASTSWFFLRSSCNLRSSSSSCNLCAQPVASSFNRVVSWTIALEIVLRLWSLTFGAAAAADGACVTVAIGLPDCAEAMSFGPFADEKGTLMADLLNVNPRAVINQITLVRCGYGSNIELFQYSSPDQKTVTPKNSDVGGYHIAFYVDDIKAAKDYLDSKGVKTFFGPFRVNEGPARSMGRPKAPDRRCARAASTNMAGGQRARLGRGQVQAGVTGAAFQFSIIRNWFAA